MLPLRLLRELELEESRWESLQEGRAEEQGCNSSLSKDWMGTFTISI